MLEGTYYKTISRNLLTGETTFLITPNGGYKTKSGLVKCQGKIGIFVKGIPVQLKGKFDGDVFQAESCIIPSGNRDQVYKLITFIDNGIAESKIDKIAKATNNNLLGYVASGGESEKILECLIPSKTIQAVLDNTADERTITRFINAKNTVKKIYARVGNILLQELMVRKLLGYGVDIGKIEMLCKKRITLQDIQKNPYLTLLRFGIPITASEMFAWDNGLRDEYSLKRLCGFTYDALDFTRKCGDSCCEFGRLLNIVNRRISMYSAAPVVSDIFSRSLLYCCITQLDKYMACHKVGDKIYVYFNSIWEEEQKVVRNIKRLEENRKEIIPVSSIEDIEEKLGIKYNEEQKEVFKAITTTGVKILTGPPGSGKTAVIRGLMEYYGEACHLSATTGMAAQVMQEACGQTAETVHRMLDITPYDERLRGRSLNEPVSENFVVVDEMSMCGLQLFAAMLGGIKSGSILLLVGDEDQLQSVEYGNILHDLINSGVIEVYRLREVLRQSGTIYANAGKINQGICSLDYDDKFIVRNFSSDIDAVNAVKAATTLKSTILSPIKAYGDYGTRYLNKLLQGHSGDVLMSYGDVDYRLHDKIVMTDNNYTAGYVNGDIGEIIGIEDGCLIVSLGENRTLTIERDCMSDMDLAYALTIHKSQGSGFDDVHIILQSTSENMLSRRLLYTAVTRAKRKVTIYNVGSAINTAIINTKEYKRFSLLPLFLVQK